ncbi:hypothetical protein QTO34_004158 [Cnephaeus nilssonii]|uniref:Uncharacterized protein n=1 Tax=Cnephaeus nilssonii TaxID=3371016 RepID=A0AA40HSA4_CNENI|nr:hypothetical protein QTO34_004158 [Eptesicus nilssonii]
MKVVAKVTQLRCHQRRGAGCPHPDPLPSSAAIGGGEPVVRTRIPCRAPLRQRLKLQQQRQRLGMSWIEAWCTGLEAQRTRNRVRLGFLGLAWPPSQGLCRLAKLREAPRPGMLRDAHGSLTAPRGLLPPHEARCWMLHKTPPSRDCFAKLVAAWVTALLSSQPSHEAVCHHHSTVPSPAPPPAPLMAIEEVEKLLLTWINEKQLASESILEAMTCEKAKMLHTNLGKMPL